MFIIDQPNDPLKLLDGVRPAIAQLSQSIYVMPLNKIAYRANVSSLAYIEGPGRNHSQLIVPFNRCPKNRPYVFFILNHSLLNDLVVFVHKTIHPTNTLQAITQEFCGKLISFSFFLYGFFLRIKYLTTLSYTTPIIRDEDDYKK